jgi:hypothetical protein
VRDLGAGQTSTASIPIVGTTEGADQVVITPSTILN